MASQFWLACFAALVAVCAAQSSTSAESFKYLAVTLPADLNPLHFLKASKFWFNKIPLTQTEAVSQGWTQLEGSSCANNGRYSGLRFLPKEEKSIAALYDSQGVIAGFQALYRVQSIVNGSNDGGCSTLNKGVNNYNFDQPMINRETINGAEYFVLTAYFVEPETICSSTRNPATVSTDGFGNTVYLQNGPTPADLIQAPPTRAEASAEGWTNNTCLPLNGHHNFYRTQDWESTQCTQVRPSWLFYGQKYELSGFGFSLPGCDGSWRFQHPPAVIVNYVVNSPCFKKIAETIQVSNINVYLKKPASTLLDCVDPTGFMSTLGKFL